MAPVYDFNAGYPDLDIVPKDDLATLTAELTRTKRGLQYGGDLKGAFAIRDQVAHFLRSQTGMSIYPGELMITTGSVHALDIAARSLSNPGDIILVERPTFFFALTIFQMSRLEIISVPLNTDGIDLEALQAILAEHGSRVKLLYTIPSFQNPTGICATDQNRAALVDLAVEHNFTIIEDAAYQFLYFNAAPPPLLKHYDHGRGHVVTAGTFSKIITPSLRQGWLWGTTAQIERFTHFKSDASASLLTGELVAEYIRQGKIEEQLARVRTFYKHKMEVLSDAMHEYLPGWMHWQDPAGGFFIWATIPEDHSAAKIRTAALKHDVDFMPGHLCFPTLVTDRYLRFCFAMLPEATLVEGTRILGQIIREL